MTEAHLITPDRQAPTDRPVMLWAQLMAYPYNYDWTSSSKRMEPAGSHQWVVAAWCGSGWVVCTNDEYSAKAANPLYWAEVPPDPTRSPSNVDAGASNLAQHGRHEAVG